MIKEFSSHSYLRHVANVKLHNGGTLGLGRCRNVSGILNSSLQQLCNGSFLSVLLFTFSALKEPAKELNYQLCWVRNIWTKYFYYFQGLRALKCHRTKRSNRMNYRSKWHLQKTFSSSTPPLPPGFPESLTPPPARIPQSHQSEGGGGGRVDFFWNNPIWMYNVLLHVKAPVTNLIQSKTIENSTWDSGSMPLWIPLSLLIFLLILS